MDSESLPQSESATALSPKRPRLLSIPRLNELLVRYGMGTGFNVAGCLIVYQFEGSLLPLWLLLFIIPVLAGIANVFVQREFRRGRFSDVLKHSQNLGRTNFLVFAAMLIVSGEALGGAAWFGALAFVIANSLSVMAGGLLAWLLCSISGRGHTRREQAHE